MHFAALKLLFLTTDLSCLLGKHGSAAGAPSKGLCVLTECCSWAHCESSRQTLLIVLLWTRGEPGDLHV